MNNDKLIYEIDQINMTVNELDRLEKLFAFEPKYKKSDFYKHTKMSLSELFKWLTQIKVNKVFTMLQDMLNGDTLAATVTEWLNNIDAEQITNFFEAITTALDPTQLKEQQGVLTTILDKIPVQK